MIHGKVNASHPNEKAKTEGKERFAKRCRYSKQVILLLFWRKGDVGNPLGTLGTLEGEA